MAAGELELEVAGAADMQPDSPPPAKAAFGFTSAQQIMFQSSNMNGHRVVMVTPEVARSLGIVTSDDGGAAETAIQIQDSGDVSVSVMDTEEDGMIDPDQFLAMELASGKAEAVVDEDLTSLSWLHSKNLIKASDFQFRSGAAAGEAGQAAAAAAAAEAAERRGPMSAAPLLVEESVISEFSEESPTSDYLEELPEAAPAVSYAAPAPAHSSAAAAALSSVAAARSAAAAAAAAAEEAAERVDCGPDIGGGGGNGWKFGNGRVKRHPPHLPYDPKVHVHFKPPFSFSCLIFMSIEDSPLKAMPVKDIYNWIQEHFPFYQAAPIGWKNSVRHNLSLNKCFSKIEKSPGPGKGSLWTVDPLFRPHLIQALKRSPCVQETPAGATSRTVYRPWSAAAAALGGQLPAGPPRRPPAARRPAAALTPSSPDWNGISLAGPGGEPRSTESLEAAAAAAVPAVSAPPPRMTPRRRPSRGAKRSSSVGPARSQSDDSGPNPHLFPLLSRRLLSGSGDGAASPADHQGGATSNDEEPQLMIVQEPPPPETPPARCRVKVVRRPPESAGHDYGPAAPPARTLASPYHHHHQPGTSPSSRLNPRLVIIRRSPEEEHTYARDPLRRLTATPHHSHHPHPQLLSDDEAFSDDSNLSVHDPSGRTGGLSPEEAGIRLVQEGADLLLNLAGVPPSDITAARRAVAGPRRGRGRGRGAGTLR